MPLIWVPHQTPQHHVHVVDRLYSDQIAPVMIHISRTLWPGVTLVAEAALRLVSERLAEHYMRWLRIDSTNGKDLDNHIET